MLATALIFNVLVGLAFCSFIIYLIGDLVKGIKNPKTRMGTLIGAGIALALIVFLVASFIYQFKKSFLWNKEPYEESFVAEYYLTDELADLITFHYERHGTGDSENWYQSDWYSSADELASLMPFDDEEQRIEFIEGLDEGTIEQDSSYLGLDRIPNNRNREVWYYRFGIHDFGRTRPGDYTYYFIVIDQDTNEASLGVYDLP